MTTMSEDARLLTLIHTECHRIEALARKTPELEQEGLAIYAAVRATQSEATALQQVRTTLLTRIHEELTADRMPEKGDPPCP